MQIAMANIKLDYSNCYFAFAICMMIIILKNVISIGLQHNLHAVTKSKHSEFMCGPIKW